MDRLELAEFAKVSENKELPEEFTADVQEQGIEQGALIVSKLYNTMLGAITRVMKSWDTELTSVLTAAGFTPSALTNTQLYNSIIKLIKDNTNGLQLGDIVPNAGTKTPLGRMLCNGQWIENCKDTFPDFYNYVLSSTPYVTAAEYEQNVTTYGQCGFMAVDGVRVRLPLITRPISGISNAAQCGQAILDTMRPITGSCGTFGGESRGDIAPGGGTGALWRETGVDKNEGKSWDGGSGIRSVNIDTSRLGPRYSGSETRGKQIQYPYCIQVYTAPIPQSLVDTAELIDLLKYQNQVGITKITATSGNVPLSSGGIYTMTISGNTTFVLPTPTDKTTLNQILVQLSIASTDASINWGTSSYFSGQPSTSVGNYNVIYEYDVLLDAWVVGQVEKISL